MFEIFKAAAPILAALIAGGIGAVAVWWRWKLDGRSQFLAVTADQRCTLETTAPLGVPDYFRHSIPILRQAVYRVKPFAKNWTALEATWLKYKSEPEDDFESVAGHYRAHPINPRTDDDLREPKQRLLDYLDAFDRNVA